MFEEALVRDMVEGSDGVPTAVVAWLVTGQWPVPALSCDVSFPRAEWSRIADIY